MVKYVEKLTSKVRVEFFRSVQPFSQRPVTIDGRRQSSFVIPHISENQTRRWIDSCGYRKCGRVQEALSRVAAGVYGDAWHEIRSLREGQIARVLTRRYIE